MDRNQKRTVKLYGLCEGEEMKAWTSTITYSVFDMGRECKTEEEYKEWVKESFREEHNIELEDRDITDIEFEDVSDD